MVCEDGIYTLLNCEDDEFSGDDEENLFNGLSHSNNSYKVEMF